MTTQKLQFSNHSIKIYSQKKTLVFRAELIYYYDLKYTYQEQHGVITNNLLILGYLSSPFKYYNNFYYYKSCLIFSI